MRNEGSRGSVRGPFVSIYIYIYTRPTPTEVVRIPENPLYIIKRALDRQTQRINAGLTCSR